MKLQVIERQNPQTYLLADPDGVRVEARLRSAWGIRLNLFSENPKALINSLLKWRLDYELWARSAGAQVLQVELPAGETVPPRFNALFPALSMVIYQASQAGSSPAPDYVIRKLTSQESGKLQTRLFEVAHRFSTNFSSSGWTFIQGLTDFEKAAAGGTLYAYGDKSDRAAFYFIDPTAQVPRPVERLDLIGVYCYKAPSIRGSHNAKTLLQGFATATHEYFGASRTRSVVACNNLRMLAAFREVPGVTWFRSHQRFIG